MIAAVVAFAVILGGYGASRVAAANPEDGKDVVLSSQEIFLVKQDTARVPADQASLAVRQVTPFVGELPDVSNAATRVLLLGTVVTLWLSTRYFTRLLS